MIAAGDEAAERLRASVLRLRAPQVAQRAPTPVSSVYGRAAAACPDEVRTATRRDVLDARFRNVETSALMSGTTMALLVHPDPGDLPTHLRRGLQLLVEAGASVLALGPDLPRSVSPGAPVTLPLRGDDALAQEWALLACGPRKRAAFLARKAPDGGWWWLLTRDSIAVHRAGTAILERAPFLRLHVPPLSP